MNQAKRMQREQRGGKPGSTTEFPGLSAEEARFIALTLACRRPRKVRTLTQTDLAR